MDPQVMRFAFFVDGSNLFGSLKDMSVEVDDYQRFFDYLYGLAEQTWRATVKSGKEVSTRLQRVYWYEVGSIDDWDLSDAQAQGYLKQRFDSDTVLKAGYMAQAGKAMPGKTQADVALRAWTNCFDEMSQWYNARVESLDKIRRFHHGVRTSTDIIDVLEVVT